MPAGRSGSGVTGARYACVRCGQRGFTTYRQVVQHQRTSCTGTARPRKLAQRPREGR